ncbi:RidA family protein [Paenibacillus sp. IB182496]|uniref:RidA family protein n=1 Tax=Paenibacillus sabuli TaxID=2772509 RepID=A0A927BXQ7_9BACL|nr:RidA family protein [Paenibacillus sabuli]MBD2848287.1 RidA family protein [Paenibacillus sabuli]
MSKAFQTPEAPQFPLPFSHGVRAGDFVYVSGQVGVHPDTLELAGPGIEEQTEQTFANIALILATEGLTLDHVVKVNAFLSDGADLPAYNEVYRRLVAQPFPSRTSIVCGIGGYKIEVDVIAYAPDTRRSE